MIEKKVGEDVFLVGRWPDEDSQRWQVQGIYATREAAMDNAQPGWFIGAIRIEGKFEILGATG